MNITIGIPAYNEEKNIGEIIKKLKNISKNIIVCDDGSNDNTGSIAKSLGAIVIKHEKNLGYGKAIKSIFSEARKINSEVLITFDGDGQHRIEDIPCLLEPIMNGDAEIVIGSRFLKNETIMPKYRKIGVQVITKVTNASINEKLTDSQSGFRAYSKRILDEIIISENGMGVSTEILIKSNQKNFRIVEVPIIILYNGNTSTHNPVSHGTSVLLSTIKFTSIQHPLKFYGIPSLFFLILGMSFLVWTIQIYAEETRIVTNIALVGIASLILGVILMISAILLYAIITVIRETKN